MSLVEYGNRSAMRREENIFKISNILSRNPNSLHIKTILKEMDQTPATLYKYLKSIHQANSKNEKYQKYLKEFKTHNELQEKEIADLKKLSQQDIPNDLKQFTKDNLSKDFLDNLFYFTCVFKFIR